MDGVWRQKDGACSLLVKVVICVDMEVQLKEHQVVCRLPIHSGLHSQFISYALIEEMTMCLQGHLTRSF